MRKRVKEDVKTGWWRWLTTRETTERETQMKEWWFEFVSRYFVFVFFVKRFLSWASSWILLTPNSCFVTAWEYLFSLVMYGKQGHKGNRRWWLVSLYSSFPLFGFKRNAQSTGREDVGNESLCFFPCFIFDREYAFVSFILFPSLSFLFTL